ncbi:MAG: biopolymer transporter ExbD [Lentisphaerae bacterium]|nr:biopolymer transporter ExbD [Lentisphaerota bacterium]
MPSLRRTPITTVRQISEINLTPLMDLTFLLLITFIITFPLIEQGIQVQLPEGKARDIEADKARTITVDQAGAVFLDDVAISWERLPVEMSSLGKRAPETLVLVRADERLPYGRIVKVLRVLNDAGLNRMALVTKGEEARM